MIKANKENYQRLTVYVTAGKQKLQEAYDKDIPELEAIASQGNQEDAEKLNALKQATNLFALQVADLETQMALSMTLAIQLTNMNYANYALIQLTTKQSYELGYFKWVTQSSTEIFRRLLYVEDKCYHENKMHIVSEIVPDAMDTTIKNIQILYKICKAQ